jgi:hypothetical protein
MVVRGTVGAMASKVTGTAKLTRASIWAEWARASIRTVVMSTTTESSKSRTTLVARSMSVAALAALTSASTFTKSANVVAVTTLAALVLVFAAAGLVGFGFRRGVHLFVLGFGDLLCGCSRLCVLLCGCLDIIVLGVLPLAAAVVVVTATRAMFAGTSPAPELGRTVVAMVAVVRGASISPEVRRRTRGTGWSMVSVWAMVMTSTRKERVIFKTGGWRTPNMGIVEVVDGSHLELSIN